MPVDDLNDTNFKSWVLEPEALALVDFTAEWCKPCKQLEPIIDQLAIELIAQIKVGRLDIDQNVESTMWCGVMGVPTLILFKNGQPVERLSGYVPKPKILEKIKKHLG